MPGNKFESSRIYLNVVQGALRQTVEEGEEGAKKRTYEKKDGTTKDIWEIVYRSWEGTIQRISLKDTDFGQFINIDFPDARVSFNVDSRYFADFVKKIMGADFSKEFKLSPYNFESEGKRVVGISIEQEGEKLKNYFYNDVDKVYCNGFPIPNEAEKNKSGYWKTFFGYTVKNFLLDQLAALRFGNEVPYSPEEVKPDLSADDIPIVQQEAKINIDNPLAEEVNGGESVEEMLKKVQF